MATRADSAEVAHQDERFDLAAHTAAPSPEWAGTLRAKRGGWRYMPQRWLLDLLGLAAAGVLLMAAALTGLAAVSSSIPPLSTARGSMPDQPGGADALDVMGNGLCCRETQ